MEHANRWQHEHVGYSQALSPPVDVLAARVDGGFCAVQKRYLRYHESGAGTT